MTWQEWAAVGFCVAVAVAADIRKTKRERALRQMVSCLRDRLALSEKLARVDEEKLEAAFAAGRAYTEDSVKTVIRSLTIGGRPN